MRRRRAVDAADVERVYRARYGVFLRVAVAIVRDEGLAEEVVHDAFVRALRHLGRFDGRGSFDGWLWRIVVNEARRRETGERRGPRMIALAEAPDAPGRNGYAESGRIAALVSALPERQRLALFLRYYADLDYQTIADALGVRPGTVAATLNAAHAALRRELVEAET